MKKNKKKSRGQIFLFWELGTGVGKILLKPLKSIDIAFKHIYYSFDRNACDTILKQSIHCDAIRNEEKKYNSKFFLNVVVVGLSGTSKVWRQV